MTVTPLEVEGWDVPNPPKTTSFKKEPKKNRATPAQVGFKLQQLRRDNGYRTPREAAEAAHVNVSYLHRLERGRLKQKDHLNKVRYGMTIAALAFCYSVKPEDILLISQEEDNRCD